MKIQNLYKLFLPHFRRKRLKLLYDLFKIDSSTTVADIGGGMFFWELAKQLNLPLPKLTIVNLTPLDNLPDSISNVVADGRNLPFKSSCFDLVFCNSVIEHVGTWESQVILANEIKRIARNYFVQTPNCAFPVEPHLITPFIHYLPRKAQLKLLRNYTIWGIVTRPSLEKCQAFLDEVRLLSGNEMKQLFPEAIIRTERFVTFPKSLIAVGKT